MAPLPHVVVIGGGFAGLTVARSLRRAPVRVTLIDRSNHHLFQPLLYQVATAGLAPGDIAEPIRRIFKRQPNVSVRLATARGVNVGSKTVQLDDGEVQYDYLIVATGARHHYFGNSDWETHAPGLKSVDDALNIRRRILTAFERAEWTDGAAERARLLTFVVVGAGPTGVELAGAVREIATRTLTSEFRSFEPAKDVRVVLIEGGPRVLSTFVESLTDRAKAQLDGLGVEVMTDTFVKNIDADGVEHSAGFLPTATVLWAAGVRASPLGATLGAKLDRSGRVCVGSDLSIPNEPNVFVLGDLAHFEQDGQALPGVAVVAIKQAQLVARNIVRDLAGRPRGAFRYRDLGSMATIGRSRAIADFGFVRLWGFPAWLSWVFVHLMTLVGHRNRLVVFTKWAWAWLTYERSSRLIWRRYDDG